METIKIFSALLMPVIAITTATIIVLQYQLQRYKVRHDLYEPRMKIYRSLREFLQHVLQYGNASSEQLSKLMDETSEAQFLFKGKIRDYIREVHRHALGIQIASNSLKQAVPPSEEYLNKAAQKQETEFKWFMDQIDRIDALFSEYLTFDE